MPTAPLFRRGDSVYLRSSAEIGKLEAFRITSIKQSQDGRWLYVIHITKKPPHQALIGDTYDSRVAEATLYYTEGELITVCEALDVICTRFRRKIESTQSQFEAKCGDDVPTVGLDEPKWAIGDLVYYDASARLGFLECTKVTEIFEVGIQPGSRRTRYNYKVRGTNHRLFFREDELIAYCEAAEKALLALRRDLTSAEAKQASLCI